MEQRDLGVEGYISKVASDEELIKCINIVARGGKYYPVKEESIQNEIDSIVSVLRKQEKLVFEMLLQGKSNVQIKEELFFKPAHSRKLRQLSGQTNRLRQQGTDDRKIQVRIRHFLIHNETENFEGESLPLAPALRSSATPSSGDTPQRPVSFVYQVVPQNKNYSLYR